MSDLPLEVPGDGPWRARFVDPRTMAEDPVESVEPDAEGRWMPPQKPTYADWLIVVEVASE